MRFRPLHVLTGFLLAAATFPIAQALADDTAPAAAAAEAPEPQLSPQQQQQVQLHVMAGELAAGRGQPKVAAEEFVKALEIQPDAQLAARATQLALSADDAPLALRAARRWLSLEPNSLDAREVIARLSLRAGDIEETYNQGVAIVDGHAGGEAEGFRHVALLLSAEPGQKDAVQGVMKRLVDRKPDLAAAHYALALVALRYEDFPVAEASARRSLELQESRESKLLLVGVLVRQAKLPEADKLMGELIATAKEPSDLRLTYAKLLLESGERDHARTQLEETLKADPKSDDARYALGVLAFNDGKLDEAEAYFKPLAADPDRGADAEFQLGRIDEARKKFPEALAHYEKVVSGGQAIDAAVRRAAVMTRMGKVEEARASLDQIRRQFPPLALRITLAEAEMLAEADRFDDALSVYAAGLTRDPSDADLLYGRSLVHERMNKFDLAEADLRKILASDPDDARAMNALGYMLTVNTQRFDEARKLITRALELSPDDAAVIDSMGWVEYKLGNTAAAKTWLEKAINRLPDPEIAAHLGEVLWALGEKDQARAVWEKALAREPDHRVLQDTVDRLTR
ncbi:MAG TPA: tetratricopeptide repeat protein [Nevskiaceae bacterium]|nr:tetratricopeptide repeat protein [Nevskiaceae bacterium]